MTPQTFKAIRKALGLEQKELAAKIGVSKETMYRKDNGLTSISEYDLRCLRRFIAEHIISLNEMSASIDKEITDIESARDL